MAIGAIFVVKLLHINFVRSSYTFKIHNSLSLLLNTTDGSDPSDCDDACGTTVKSLAQQIFDKHLARSITLKTSHPNGVSDGADPYNNIRDTVLGCEAKRSR